MKPWDISMRKPMDEVIAGIMQTLLSGYCPADNDMEHILQDAMSYLNEYRSDKLIWESDRKHYEDWIEQYKDSRDKHQQAVKEMLKNPPLTWDELKEMVGKPVWIQWTVMGVWAYGNWNLIQGADEDRIWFVDKDGDVFDELEKEDQGHLWQAYRKERE